MHERHDGIETDGNGLTADHTLKYLLDGLRWHVLGDSHAALHSAAEAGETTGVAVMSRESLT